MRAKSEKRFVFVVGGVLSGLGKGIVTASVGNLLKACGYKVTAIKIDPYVNVDAGTMRPTEHGEIFVTEDGGEIDQDLGTYERFLHMNLSKDNNITTGKVFLRVIERERALEYEGKTVQIIPHVSDEVKRMILEVSKNCDITLVEVGGTTGDIENLIYLHAIRELSLCYPSVTVMVSYLPFLKNVGELKTKPTQHAVARLREAGLFPDFIVVRSEAGMDEVRREKLARMCFIDSANIIDDPDIKNIYRVPLLFERQKFHEKILQKLGLKQKKLKNEKWKEFVKRLENPKEEVNIAIVGKYVTYGNAEHMDVYISILEALKHASAKLQVRASVTQVDSEMLEKTAPEKILGGFHGIIVPGGFGKRGIEGKIRAIEFARKNNIPFLGLCLGMQLAVVEFARNVCKLKGANSTEFEKSPEHAVIDVLPEQREILAKRKYGASMRLGAWKAVLERGTRVWEIYGRKSEVWERHRHRYEVNPEYVEILENRGLVFSGKSEDGRLMEFLELPGHEFFVATQAHPEFKSRPLQPHPLFVEFLRSARKVKRRKG